MNIKELTAKTMNDIEKRKEKRERDYISYTNEKHYKRIRSWNVRVGGFRW